MRLWRRRPSSTEALYGLTWDELDTLSRYNAERWRGIMHDPEWDERMALLQARYDEATAE